MLDKNGRVDVFKDVVNMCSGSSEEFIHEFTDQGMDKMRFHPFLEQVGTDETFCLNKFAFYLLILLMAPYKPTALQKLHHLVDWADHSTNILLQYVCIYFCGLHISMT